jgi:hypothetical protein
VNDLPQMTSNPVRLFADDAKVSQGFNNEEECISLQEDLDKMVSWTHDWQLQLNNKKCATLHLGSNNRQHKYEVTDISGNSTYISDSQEENDLGVTIDQKLDFKMHIAKITKKANSITGLIARNFKHLDASAFTTLYKTLVRPRLEYASPVWSPYLIGEIDRLEAVQRRATKMVKSVRKKSYEERLRTLGLPTLAYRRKRADMIQTFKICGGYDQIDPETLFRRSKSQRTRGHCLKL